MTLFRIFGLCIQFFGVKFMETYIAIEHKHKPNFKTFPMHSKNTKLKVSDGSRTNQIIKLAKTEYDAFKNDVNFRPE